MASIQELYKAADRDCNHEATLMLMSAEQNAFDTEIENPGDKTGIEVWTIRSLEELLAFSNDEPLRKWFSSNGVKF